jgi:hypothetical protein
LNICLLLLLWKIAYQMSTEKQTTAMPLGNRFAVIPNIFHGKSLCEVIKNWQEQQQQPTEFNANINWTKISQDLNNRGSANLTPSACQILWTYLAYGQVVTEADLLSPSSFPPPLRVSRDIVTTTSGGGGTDVPGGGPKDSKEVRPVVSPLFLIFLS